MKRSKTSTLTICGLDEVGRGPLAGPLVAAAVVFPADFSFAKTFPDFHLRDSKLMRRLERERIVGFIEKVALAVHIEKITVDEINTYGIGWANRTVFERLIAGLEADRYIVDGRLKLETHEKAPRVQVKVRADQTVETVSAASIVAKLNRDWMMEALHRGFPVYRWDHNKGYGTREHIAALRKYGPCRLHRRQFVETALSMQIPLWPPPEQSPVEE